MARSELPRFLTLVGVSGTGKTTLTRRLMAEDDFRVLPGIFTREPRAEELADENRRVTDEDFERMAAEPGRLLWDIKTAYGVRYGKDTSDIQTAWADNAHRYTHALVPPAAVTFAEYCGPIAVRTMFIPAPGKEVLRERMIQRGDAGDKIEERLQAEDSTDWHKQVQAIAALYVAESTTLDDLHAEAIELMSH